MVIGLTGGLGCGKSTAAAMFEALGFRRIDSDAIVRTELLVSPEIEEAIAQHFGREVMTAEGRVDRAKLASRVFRDDAELLWLEGRLYPGLFAIWKHRLAEARSAEWVVEVPLLFEKQLEKWFDFTVCVSTTSANQVARLARRGMPQHLAEQRISKQLPLAKKRELAHFVLSNDGSSDFLRTQIARLVGQLRERR